MKSFGDLKVGDFLWVNGIPERIYGIDKYSDKWLFYTTNNIEEVRFECFTSELDYNSIYTIGENKFSACELL